MSAIPVLISEANGFFRIEAIEPELSTFQKLVGGYIENVSDPGGSGLHVYINEEGKLQHLPVNRSSTVFLDSLFQAAGRAPFSLYDVLVGTAVWLDTRGTGANAGGEGAIPLKWVRRFALEQARLWQPDKPITVIKHFDDVWVFDLGDNAAALVLQSCARLGTPNLGAGKPHGVIEVYPGLSPGRWTEIRVDIMDHPTVNLHDERVDRSYG